MRKVDPRTRTPVPATMLVLVVGVVLMVAVPGAALLELIWPHDPLGRPYGATIILYLSVRNRLDRQEGAFELGRFELPVAIGALVWAFVLFVLVEPLRGGVCGAGGDRGRSADPLGGLYFGYLLRFRRHVLMTPRAGADPE